MAKTMQKPLLVTPEFAERLERQLKRMFIGSGGINVRYNDDQVEIHFGGQTQTFSVDDEWDVIVLLTSTRSGEGGRYNGKMLIEKCNNAATGNLQASDLYDTAQVPSSENCVIWNRSEIGSSGQSLTLNKPYVGKMIGYTSDQKPIILIDLPTIPAGNYAYQVYQMTTAATTGWDWERWTV